MSVKILGERFPKKWVYSRYENDILESLYNQVKNSFDGNNLIVNSTWFGPQYNNDSYETVLKETAVDNLFFVSTVDPASITKDQYADVISQLGNPTVYWVGNFENSQHEFNFFSYAVTENFKEYANEDIVLRDLKYKYIAYNRKPREHRVMFVKELIKHDLMKDGVVTLGKPDRIYDNDPDNNLYFDIGEDPRSTQHGNWFGDDEDTGIPHDLFSLHNMDAWKHHFLYINGCTEFYPWEDVFVMQDQYRPIIGLRPFLVNGNTRTYKWLRDRGFKTFTHYFDFVDLEEEHEDKVHPNLIEVIKWLNTQTDTEILSMYDDMMPALLHNQSRMYEFAREQHKKMKRLF